jgi:hypothetical protein
MGILSPLAYILTICPLVLWGIVATHKQQHILAGKRIEFVVESLFILAGMLSLAYHYLR